MRLAVVGHVEWVEFALVDRAAAPGEIVQARRDVGKPAGGGADAAVQLAKLAGGARFFTALGDDDLGHRAADGARGARRTSRGRLARRAAAPRRLLSRRERRADDHAARAKLVPRARTTAAVGRARVDRRCLLHRRRRRTRSAPRGRHASSSPRRASCRRSPRRGWSWTCSSRARAIAGERYRPGDLDPAAARTSFAPKVQPGGTVEPGGRFAAGAAAWADRRCVRRGRRVRRRAHVRARRRARIGDARRVRGAAVAPRSSRRAGRTSGQLDVCVVSTEMGSQGLR